LFPENQATPPIWFALPLTPTTIGVLDGFAREDDRRAHLAGD